MNRYLSILLIVCIFVLTFVLARVSRIKIWSSVTIATIVVVMLINIIYPISTIMIEHFDWTVLAYMFILVGSLLYLMSYSLCKAMFDR